MRLFLVANFLQKHFSRQMGKARRAPRGRIPASEESSAQKASQRGHLIRFHGDLGESAFLHKATSLGFMVARPWRNVYSYDFVVEGGHNFWRVQVKTTTAIDSMACIAWALFRTVAHISRPYRASPRLTLWRSTLCRKKPGTLLPVREAARHEISGCLVPRVSPPGHLGPLPRSLAPAARARRPGLRMSSNGPNQTPSPSNTLSSRA